MNKAKGVTPTFVAGTALFGSAAITFCYLAITTGATMPTPTLILMLGGLAAFTYDCYKKGIREYLVFNGIQFVLYTVGGLAA